MIARDADYADLAHLVYGDEALQVERDGLKTRVGIAGVNYTVLRQEDHKPSGYQGVAVRDPRSSDIIVVHRGTQPRDGRDVMTDIEMVTRRTNEQFDAAGRLTEWAVTTAADETRVGGRSIGVTVTGHSLGGTLAQLTAHRFGLRGVTFNAYGAAGLAHGVPVGGDQVINHVMATDVVSAASAHFGRVEVHASSSEIAFLHSRAGGYGHGAKEPGSPLLTAAAHGAWMHGIEHFSRLPSRNGTPHTYSVLEDTQAAARAAQHADEISAFRDEIGVIARQIGFGAHLGGLLGRAAGDAAAVPLELHAALLGRASRMSAQTGERTHHALAWSSSRVGAIAAAASATAGEGAARLRQAMGDGHVALDRLSAQVSDTTLAKSTEGLRRAADLAPASLQAPLRRAANHLEQRAHDANDAAQTHIRVATVRTRHDAEALREGTRQFGVQLGDHIQAAGRQAGEHADLAAQALGARLAGGQSTLSARATQVQAGAVVMGEAAGAAAALAAGTASRETKAMQRAARTYLDRTHPQNALYEHLRQWLPNQIGNEKVAELVLDAQRSGMCDLDQLAEKNVVGNQVQLVGRRAGYFAHVDLAAPAPSLEDTMQQSAQLDAKREHAAAPERALSPEPARAQEAAHVH